ADCVTFGVGALRKPWESDGTNRRDYDHKYGRHLVDSIRGDENEHGSRCFVRQGWGEWTIVEFNDGQGGREKRRFFRHDCCDATLIKQAFDTCDPLAFSYSNLQRLQANVYKAMPAEMSWYYFRHRTISRDEAVAAIEADLETLRNAKP